MGQRNLDWAVVDERVNQSDENANEQAEREPRNREIGQAQ